MATNENRLNDIKIYRGTYDEIKKLPTVNMAIYLAWDRNMLLVGNNTGKKIPYGNIPELIHNEVEMKFEDLVNNKRIDELVEASLRVYLDSEEFEGLVKEELYEEIKEEIANGILEVRTMAIDALALSQEVKNEFDNVLSNFSKLEVNINSNLEKIGANITKIESDIIDLQNDSKITINNTYKYFYTKEQVDKMVIQHKKGNDIVTTPVMMRLRATPEPVEENGTVILCTEDSSDEVVKRGHLYYQNNGLTEIGYTRDVAIEDIDSAIKSALLDYYSNSEIDEKFKEVNDKINNLSFETDLSDYYNKSEIDNKLEELKNVEVDLSDYYTRDEIDVKLENLPDEPVDLSEYYTKTEVNALIPEVPAKLSELENDKGFITNESLNEYAKLEDIPEITNVPTKLSELENDVNFIKSDALNDYAKKEDIPEITNVPTKLSELENDKGFITSADIPAVDLSGYAKKEEIPTKLSELENDSLFIDQYDMIALTGDEMNALLKNTTELNKYSLVFCKKNSTSGITYKRGTLYYVDNEAFEAMSGGGSSVPVEKEVIKTTFSVTETGGTNSFEMTNSKRKLTFIIKADNVNAITNAKFNGENLDLVKLVSDSGEVVEKELNLAEPAATEFKLTYTAKVDTSLIDYQVNANRTSFVYNVIAPTFYGQGSYSEGKLQKTLETGNLIIKPKSFGFEPNNMFYLYSPIEIESNNGNDFAIEVGGFECDYSSTTEFITVNGLNCMYYVYYFNISDPDITISVER